MRVVIADDSALLREGLSRLLVESGVEVCSTVGDAAALIDAVSEMDPDVAVIDIRMPPDFNHEGAAAAVELRQVRPDLGILLLSQAIETRFASQLLERHSERFGYLLKDRVIDVSMLLGALRTIDAGGTVLDPEIVRNLMHAVLRRLVQGQPGGQPRRVRLPDGRQHAARQPAAALVARAAIGLASRRLAT